MGVTGSIRLDGRAGIVTGGGGGLGRSHALLLADRGAKLIVNDIEQTAEKTVAEIIEAGGEAVAHMGSVTDRAVNDELVRLSVDTYGTVDFVVANAGTIRRSPFEEQTDDDLEQMLDEHVKGSFWLARAAYPIMKRRGYGRMVLTASDAGLYGHRRAAAYAAAKGALVGLAATIAIEGADHGILANVLNPLAATGMTPHVTGDQVHRIRPEMVSGAVVYLVSEECAVNQEIVLIGGGAVARMFTATTPGWHAARGAIVTPEDVRDHIESIRVEDGYVIPGSVADDVAHLLPDLQS